MNKYLVEMRSWSVLCPEEKRNIYYETVNAMSVEEAIEVVRKPFETSLDGGYSPIRVYELKWEYKKEP